VPSPHHPHFNRHRSILALLNGAMRSPSPRCGLTRRDLRSVRLLAHAGHMLSSLLTRTTSKTLHLLLSLCQCHIAAPRRRSQYLTVSDWKLPALLVRCGICRPAQQTSDTKRGLPAGLSSTTGRAGCEAVGPLETRCGAMLCGLAGTLFVGPGVACDDCFAPCSS
jgi:hypothetical protein